MWSALSNRRGFTLVELALVAVIVLIIALLGLPEINRFNANYQGRSAATDFVQNLRVARAMAVKENRPYLVVIDRTTKVNRRYLMGFDGDSNNNLLTLNQDTFGICKDTTVPPDRLPDGDVLVDGIPECVRRIDFDNYGPNVIIGYGSGITPPNGPPIGPGGVAELIPPTGINLTTQGVGATTWAQLNTDGSFQTTGSVYFQHTGRGYSYAVAIRSATGAMTVWKWRGDADHTAETGWSELR